MSCSEEELELLQESGALIEVKVRGIGESTNGRVFMFTVRKF